MNLTSSSRHAVRTEGIAGSEAPTSFSNPQGIKPQRRQQQQRQRQQLVSKYGLPLFPNPLSQQATAIPLRRRSFLRTMNITSSYRHAVRTEDIEGYESAMPFANPQGKKLQRRQQLEVRLIIIRFNVPTVSSLRGFGVSSHFRSWLIVELCLGLLRRARV